MPTANRPNTQDRYRKILLAIPKYLSTFVSIVIAGITFTPATLVAFFQGQIKILDDATAAKANLHAAVQAIKDNKLKNGLVLTAFLEWIRATFVNQPAVMTEFGVAPRKAKAKTVQTKAVAVQKVIATREARHTMGPLQKKGVKGLVANPVDLGTSASAPAAPTAHPGDAPSPAAAPVTATPSPASPAPASPTAPLAPVAPAASPAVAPSGGNGTPPPHVP